MELSYRENYIINEMIHKNRLQNVYTGDMRSDGRSVYINELTKGDIVTAEFIVALKENLQGLIYFEENETKVVFITEKVDTIDFETYLSGNNVTDNFKINMITEYMEVLMPFDDAPTIIQYSIAGKENYYLKNHDLKHSGLFYIDDAALDREITFYDVKKRINDFVESVLDIHDKETTSKLVYIVSEYFHISLSDETINTVTPLHDELKKIYIYDIYLKDEHNLVEQGLSSKKVIVDEDPFEILHKKKKFALTPTHFTIAIVAIALILFLLFGNFLDNLRGTKLPLASFEKEKLENSWYFENTSEAFGNDNRIVEYKWEVYGDKKFINEFDTKDLNLSFKTEGVYKISLEVKDDYGNWSKAYAEEIYHTQINLTPLGEQDDPSIEKLDNLTLDLDDDKFVYDNEVYRNGDKSLKMIISGVGSREITFKELHLENVVNVSFWIKGLESSNKITFNLIGFSDDEEVFNSTKSILPTDDKWYKIEFKEIVDAVDTLKLTISTTNNTVWIDDFEVNSYK